MKKLKKPLDFLCTLLYNLGVHKKRGEENVAKYRQT
nr:MAG TPA: hypothetical protein [Caudoviricetes sp.]